MLGRLIARFFRSRERGPRPGLSRLDYPSKAVSEAAMLGEIRLSKYVECDDTPGHKRLVQHWRDSSWTCTCRGSEPGQPCPHIRKVQAGE